MPNSPENQKKWSTKRFVSGICRTCPKPRDVPHWHCRECLNQRAKREKKRRAERLANGMCQTGGCKCKAITGQTMCERHRAITRLWWKKYRRKSR